jgi:sigma-B regulation protein RsbU (phosphoserine phosphatase)
MDERIQILVRQRGNALDVELVDSAPKVNEEACHGRPLDEVRPGGLGTHLIRAFTDRVRYRPAPGGQGNRLVLTKLLHHGSDSEHS